MHNILAVLFLLPYLLIAGCGPTYRAADFESSIKKLCREQYKKEIRVQISGRTARIYADFENLFDPKTLGISRDAADKMDDILLAIHRVTLSTDKPLDFYVFVARSEEIKGAQVVLIRYIQDSRRLLLGDISRGDYFDRMIIEANIDTRLIAEDKVRELFNDLAGYKGMNDILRAHFRQDASVEDISLEFITLASERWLKAGINYEMLTVNSKREEPSNSLVYCRVREVYAPKRVYNVAPPVFPSGFVGEYIIEVSVLGASATIDKVIPLVRIVEGRPVKIGPPSIYSDYLSWGAEDKFSGDIKLSDFLAEQLARRIRARLSQDKLVALNYEIKDVAGEYAQGPFAHSEGEFIFSLGLKKKEQKADAPKDEKTADEKYLVEQAFKLIAQVLRRYEFNDYRSITIIDKEAGARYSATKDELIKYR